MAKAGYYNMQNTFVDWDSICQMGKVEVSNGEITNIDSTLKGTLIVPSGITFKIQKPSWGFFKIFYDFEKEVAPRW